MLKTQGDFIPSKLFFIPHGREEILGIPSRRTLDLVPYS